MDYKNTLNMKGSENMSIKEKLQFFVNCGMQVSYIAKRMEVDPSTLTKWLNGQKGITHKNESKLNLTLKEIADELSALFAV